MKILFITPECPFPPEKSGGVHTVFSLIRASGGHDIDIVYYGNEDKDAEKELFKYAGSVLHLPLLKTSRLGHAKSVLSRVPYAQYQFSVPNYLESSQYDEVILDQFSSLQFSVALGSDRKPVALMHDSMPLFFSRKAELAEGIISKLYYLLQSRFAARSEAAFAGHCRKLVYVSDYDASEASSRLSGLTECESIALGVEDLAGVNKKELGESIVFTGIMDYGPNQDAAIYFADEVFPVVAKKFPNAKLYLVGKNPPDNVKALGQKNDRVVVTGYVDSVFQYILGATVYVSPLRYGTGVKNKVLEALQCRKASVFSPISVDGISEIRNGENCLIAANTDEWISKVSLLLSSAEARAKLERRLEDEPIGQHRSWRDSFIRLIGD